MRFRVSGHSMYPLLKDGQFVQIKPFYHLTGTTKPGDVIVFQHPFRNLECVKKVKKINPDGSVVVAGVAIESEDMIGAIPRTAIIGIVTGAFPSLIHS